MNALRQFPRQASPHGFAGALASLSRASIVNNELAPTIAATARLVAQTTAHEYGLVAELSDSLELMRIRSLWGWPGTVCEGSVLEIEPESISAYALLSGIAVVEDLGRQRRPRPHALLRNNKVVGAAEVAIRKGHTPIGLIGVYSPRPLVLGADALDFLRAAANILALAFERERACTRPAAPREPVPTNTSADGGWLKAVFENSQDGIALIAPATLRCLAANPALAELLGLPAERIIGRTVPELNIGFKPADITDLIERVRSCGRLSDCQCEIGAAGGPRPALVSFVLHAIDSQPAVLMFVRDVSTRKREEAQLARALADSRLKSGILASASHEIRTPLNIILGYSELIGDHLRQNGDRSQHPYVDAVRRASRRLRETIDQLLEYSRIDHGGFEPCPQTVDLNSVAAQAVRMIEPLAGHRRVELSSELEHPVVFHFDPQCLNRALAHLLRYAIKAVGSGRIALKLRRYAEGALGLDVYAEIGRLVRDPPYLASPEVGGEHDGNPDAANLDYELARRYLEAGGALLEERRSRGMITLTIRFPNLDPRQSVPQSKSATVPNPWAMRRARILLVTSDSAMEDYLRAMLGSAYDVAVADPRHEAVQILDSGTRIDLLMIDLPLDENKNNLGLIRTIRADWRWKSVPIVALTSHIAPEERGRSIAAGCDAHLSKPVDREALINLVASLMRDG